MPITPDKRRQEKANQAPVVFQFQPKFFQRLESDEQLREWERLLADECGIKLGAPSGEFQPNIYKQWVRGESISGSGDGWDDCDYYP